MGAYWRLTREPRYSLLFALPLLVCYQVLAALQPVGPHGSLRSGADGREEDKRCERGSELHGTPGSREEGGAVIIAVIPRSGGTRDLARDSRTLAAEFRACGEDPSLRSG